MVNNKKKAKDEMGASRRRRIPIITMIRIYRLCNRDERYIKVFSLITRLRKICK